MQLLGLLFLIIAAILTLTSDRRYVTLPIIAGLCYMTIGQRVAIGPFNFPLFRVLLLAAVVRIFLRKEYRIGKFNSVDWLVCIWGGWMFFASMFHSGEGAGPVFASGIVFNVACSYFVFRCLCRGIDDLRIIAAAIAIILVPVALEMVQEKLTGKNLFALLGSVDWEATVREGKIRAQATFRSPILAGTIGAVALPLLFGLWRTNRKLASTGILACLVIILTSASSGPILTAAAGVFACLLWPVRRYTRHMWGAACALYVLLEIVMPRPAVYLISKIDLAGGSTSWYRARLLDSSFEHLSEWWAIGTDKTRHWMPSGITWSEEHTDITSYYIQFGVWSGLLGLILLVAIVVCSFFYVEAALALQPTESTEAKYFKWCAGAGLFAHAVTCLSVSYFDQSQVFFWLNVGIIGALRSTSAEEESRQEDPSLQPFDQTPTGRFTPVAVAK